MKKELTKKEKLAEEVLVFARNTLLVNLRFLDMAMSQIRFIPSENKSFMIDGEFLIYNADFVFDNFKKSKETITRDYLHMIMHCIFRHMFMDVSINRPLWDLACDIAVENMISELRLNSCKTSMQKYQEKYIQEIEKKAGKLTAEKIYHYLLEEGIDEKTCAEIRGYFYSDNHELWYMSDSEKNNMFGTGNGGADNSEMPDIAQNAAGKVFMSANQMKLDSIWNDISSRMQVDIETFGMQQGFEPGSMIQNLKEVNREKYDYTAFLKKFAVIGEVMKINDDEFDYIYYTYGLNNYKNMPLIEPLEYKDVKRIREFVIAIDTSGSVEGELVQTFLQKTYNILLSTESFFSKINLHIIQCDAEIQEHIKITSQKEFEDCLNGMTIKGLGGTDFRPVFKKVDELIKNKEFTNLKGLIYFTDGYGDFPSKKPCYNTAFVFIDEEYNNYNVPPWAIKLILQKEDI